MKNKKQQIIKFLNEEGRSSTTKIAIYTNSNTWHIKRYLEELEKDGIIKKEEETFGTYWKIIK